ARRVGVVLVRRGGYAAGVFDGTALVASKVGSRLVQGRTAAGGWSQQRFARRRSNQAGKALEAAAETALRVLTPHLHGLDAVVLLGDRRAVFAMRIVRRKGTVLAMEMAACLTVPVRKLVELKVIPALLLAGDVVLTDLPGGGLSRARHMFETIQKNLL